MFCLGSTDMQDRHIEEIAQLLKSIAHPLRLKILCLLQEKELSVGALRDQVHSSNANVSQHLAIMRRQGIITCRRDANFIHNRIADPRVTELIKTMQHLFCHDEGAPPAGR
ncbi:MAG: transcriptional regulator [Desulfobulbaceae bacterium A2]|nr:MAG: transcriptional regulator [Desulfobulbaceae bacterium A2]